MNTTSTRSAPTASPAAKVRLPTSGTGTSTSDRSAGFTLVEILVVLLIIGIVSTGALLSLGVVGGGDRPLDDERRRLEAALTFVREQAALQNREFGFRVFPGGYEFLVYEYGPPGQPGRWTRVTDERLLARHELPPGLDATVRVDGRPVVLPKRDANDAAPQVLLYSSGDLNAFEVTLRREREGAGFRFAPADDEDDVRFTTLDAGARG